MPYVKLGCLGPSGKRAELGVKGNLGDFVCSGTPLAPEIRFF